MKNYKHILLATDLHSDNSPVIEQAVALSKRNNAKLSVVNVLPHIPYYMASGVPSISDLEDYLEEENLKHLKALEAQIDLEADFHLLHGSPKRMPAALPAFCPCTTSGSSATTDASSACHMVTYRQRLIPRGAPRSMGIRNGPC